MGFSSKKMDKRLIAIIISGSLLVIIGVLIFVFGRIAPPSKLIRGNLVLWGIFDDKNVWESMIKSFESKYPGIDVQYSNKQIANYESEILNRLATQGKLDMFMVNNMWLPRYLDKIEPLSPSVLSLASFRNNFAEVAESDFIDKDGQILGVPLYSDTLALFYNRDYFNQSGISSPPDNWDDFSTDVRRLTVIDEFGNIKRSGAAFGGSENINRSSDIISVLMMQGGAEMAGWGDDQASLNNSVTVTDESRKKTSVKPGSRALEFYTSFTNPLKNVYAWGDSKNFNYSIDAFANGSAAMMINYHYNKRTVLSKAPNLNFNIASLPQIEGNGRIDYANYFGVAVSNTVEKSNLKAVQNFMSWLASQEAQELYMDLTNSPPIHRALIEQKLGDQELGVFANQALTARSWYQADNREVDAAFVNMIKSVVSGKVKIDVAINIASDRITRSMRNR